MSEGRKRTSASLARSKARNPAELGNYYLSRRIGGTTNGKGSGGGDANFPGFTCGWFPIKPSRSLPFSDTARSSLARTKSLPALLPFRRVSIISRQRDARRNETSTKETACVCEEPVAGSHLEIDRQGRARGRSVDDGGFATVTAEGIGRDSRLSRCLISREEPSQATRLTISLQSRSRTWP